MQTVKSPYSASITGCAFLFYEFVRILPLLMSEHSAILLKEEIADNTLLHVNSLASRKRFVAEFKRRYDAVPRRFWELFAGLSEKGQRAALLFAIIKTYKLVFDFHFNVTVKKWNSADQTVDRRDVLMELDEISARDSFVDSWTELTKTKCASQYLTILRQSGLLKPENDELRPLCLDAKDYAYYIASGEEWFLSACLLYPYEINNIKEAISDE